MSGSDAAERAIKPSVFSIINNPSEASSGAKARTGKLELPGRQPIQTPNFLANTSRGVIPHISPDAILPQAPVPGVFTAIEDYIEKASRGGIPPIMLCQSDPSSTPLHTFACLPQSIPTVMAPRRTPAVTAPKGNPDSGLAVFTSVGFQSLSPKAYADYVNHVKPDITIALGDIAYGPLPGRKRANKMAERTSMWVDSMLSHLEKNEVDASGSQTTKTALFAPILPSDIRGQSYYLMHVEEELAPKLSGLAIYDSALISELERYPATENLARLSLDEPAGPHEILRQVELGIDLFALPFVTSSTEAGLALTFTFPPSVPATTDGKPVEDNAQPLAIDLSDAANSTAVEPLSPGCECYTCTSHHRAYINHLLSAHEMLAWTLLQIHNHRVMSDFFLGIREAIAAGRFAETKAAFERVYQKTIEEGKAQKPRLRGYHAKSSGGDPKRNAPAWGALGEGGVPETVQSPAIPTEDADVLDDKGFAEKLDL